MRSAKKIALFDTNILIYAHDKNSPKHEIAKELRGEALNAKINACVTPQILLEFFSVTTSLKQTQNPFSLEEAKRIIDDYLYAGKFTVIIPTVETVFEFRRLLDKYLKKIAPGAHVFDVYLAATLLSAGIKTIYTENTEDFSFFKEIEVINPFS